MPHMKLYNVFHVSYACACAVGNFYNIIASIFSTRDLEKERGENPGQETAQALVQSYKTIWHGMAWHVMT